MRRRLVLVMLVWAVLPGAARAGDIEATGEVEPASAQPGDRLTYRLQLTGGDEPERFVVHVSSAYFEAMVPEGAVLELGHVSVSGDAVMGGGSIMIGDIGPGLHGTGYQVHELEVELPAHGRAVVEASATAVWHTLWPQMRHELRFGLHNAFRGQDRPIGTLEEEQEIPVAPTYTGRRSPKIVFDTAPASSIRGSSPVHPAGSTMSITGKISPAVPGAQIRLAYSAGERGDVEIGRPVADDAGTFRLDGWVPPPDRHIAVRAFYDGSHGDLANDFTTPRYFRTGPAPPPAPPDAEPAPPGPAPRAIPAPARLRVFVRRRGRRLLVRFAAGAGNHAALRVTVDLKDGMRFIRRVRRTMRAGRSLTLKVPAGATHAVIRVTSRAARGFAAGQTVTIHNVR